MRTIIPIVFIIFLSGCNGMFASHFGEDWSMADSQRQILGTQLHIIDHGTTKDLISREYTVYNASQAGNTIYLGAEKKRMHDLNPLIEHNRNKTDEYFLTTLALQELIPPCLSPGFWRTTYQVVWIAGELFCDINNFSKDLEPNFGFGTSLYFKYDVAF